MKTMKPEEVKRIRERLQLTQGEFAKRVGVNRVTVNRWESGVQAVSKFVANTIRAIAKEERAA